MKMQPYKSGIPILQFSNFQIGKLLLIITVIVTYSCRQSNEHAVNQPTTKKPPYVKVQPVTKTRMVSFIDITGTVQANIFSDIKSPSDGIIEKLFARENQWVTKDQLIAIINPNDRMALIANSQLLIQKLEQKLKTTDQNTEAYENLIKELEKAKSDLDYAKKMYQTIPVICPMNGMITHRWLDEGSQVGAKEKILTISDMSTLVIKAEVNEKFFPAIATGKKLSVILDAFPGDTLVGVISLIYPEISADTRTVKFDVKLVKSNKKILPGMMAQLRIPTEIHENTIAIPSDAVLTNPANERFVFVVNKDSMAFKRIVKTGISAKKQIEILSGLNENEEVVVLGQEMLKDSLKVKIVNLKMK
ncbi:MAG: efflux RND transporter periplasmic adaptor subunit [Bacteroidales bacterium]